MIRNISVLILVIVALSLTAPAQESEKLVPVLIRAILHDPVHPTADLFYTNKAGAIVQVEFRPKDLTEVILMLPFNGSLVLYDKAAVDPKNPAASLAASVKLPADLKQAIVVVLPAPAGEKPAYRMLLIDDSEKGFPQGESRALSLVGVETAIQAGEHRLPVHPGKIVTVPRVKNVNDYNMAQTNFYYQDGGSWVTFAERQLQYLDFSRRIFIIYATPGAVRPTVSTILDANQRAMAR